MGLPFVKHKYLNRMTKKSKKILAVLVAAVLFFVFLLWIFLYQKPKSQKVISPPPSPKIPSLLKSNPAVEVNFGKEVFATVPKEVFPIDASPLALTADYGQKIAKNLGIDTSPIVANDVFDGKVYIYNSPSSSLTIYVDIGKVSYSLSSLPQTINKQLTDDALVKIAKEFLIKNGFVNPDEIEFSSFLFIKEKDGEEVFSTTKASASFYQVNFRSKASDIPIISLNPQKPFVFVQILPDGSVFRASVQKLALIKKGQGVLKIKTYQEVLDSVKNAKIVSLDNGNIHLPDLPKNSVKTIYLKNIKLAYIFDSPETKSLSPVFLFEGEAVVEGYDKPISAVLYLPAVSNQP